MMWWVTAAACLWFLAACLCRKRERQYEAMFDLGEMIGIGTADHSPLPLEWGMITLRVKKCFSFYDLFENSAEMMIELSNHKQEEEEHLQRVIEPGIYYLRIPVPGSNNSQNPLALLSKEEAPAPVALVAAALLCLKKAGKPDPLQGNWTLCDNSLAIIWNRGSRLLVKDLYWVRIHRWIVSLSSVRKS